MSCFYITDLDWINKGKFRGWGLMVGEAKLQAVNVAKSYTFNKNDLFKLFSFGSALC